MNLFFPDLSLASHKKLIFLLFAFQMTMMAAVFPLRAEDTAPAGEKTIAAGRTETTSLEKEPAGTVGIARCYAKKFNGRRTSSGAIHDPKKLTAAHSSLPFGARVKVVNLANNKSVIVTVNDRCRAHERPFIDLSRQAARQLGMIRQGKAKVRIILVENDDPSGEVPVDAQN